MGRHLEPSAGALGSRRLAPAEIHWKGLGTMRWPIANAVARRLDMLEPLAARRVAGVEKIAWCVGAGGESGRVRFEVKAFEIRTFRALGLEGGRRMA